jgi:peptide/nickel transport system permease protein
LNKRYVASTVALKFFTVLIVITAVMVALALVPGDPARQIVGEGASEAQIQVAREQLGLDKPFYVRYINYLTSLLQGNLGLSFRFQVPVTELIAPAFSKTLTLVAAAILLSLAIGIPVGIFSAVKHYSRFDYIMRTITYAGICIPIFITGIMLLYLLTVWIPLFSVAVLSSSGIISQLALPTLTLALYTSAPIARMTRSAMLDVIRQDYITTARAKGLSETQVIFRHAFRNALIPIQTFVGLQVGMFLGGSIITESIFAYPGMGTLMVNAIFQRDFPLIQGCILVFALSFIVVNVLVDFTYALIDPRIRAR